jgi:hypothetical protein
VYGESPTCESPGPLPIPKNRDSSLSGSIVYSQTRELISMSSRSPEQLRRLAPVEEPPKMVKFQLVPSNDTYTILRDKKIIENFLRHQLENYKDTTFTCELPDGSTKTRFDIIENLTMPETLAIYFFTSVVPIKVHSPGWTTINFYASAPMSAGALAK